MQAVFQKLGWRYFIIAFTAGFIQFLILKRLYPFPDFISDSYSYIDTNLYHMKVNLWPVGYSYFISAIHSISPSHFLLVFTQFVILELALLYFFYSVLYLFEVSTTNRIILFIFLFFNPMFFYICNCVLSDAIFSALSLVLFTQYLWMYRQPRVSNLVVQALIIGIAFTIRYTAIYYPLVSIVAILMAGYRVPMKIVGMVLPWLLIFPFIKYTEQKTKEITGTAEFSVFGGWQLANNALYMYEHIDVDSTKLPEGTLALDRAARKFFHDSPPTEEDFMAVQGTFFIKIPVAVLKPYMKEHAVVTEEGAPGQFQAWGSVSPVYNKYGKYLIETHPVAFARYYMWLNTQNYFVPFLEKFGNYNLGMKAMWAPAQEWFQLEKPDVTKEIHTQTQVLVFVLYPIFFMILNIYYFFCFVDRIFVGKIYRRQRFSSTAMLLAATFLLINFGFSVFATPVVMRYQIVPMIIMVFFALYMTQLLSAKKKDEQKTDRDDRLKHLQYQKR